MSGTGRSECRSCGAPILWVLTARGRRLPLDPEPSDAGNVALRSGGAVTLSAGDAREQRDAGVLLYLSHFATCPEAEEWRKK